MSFKFLSMNKVMLIGNVGKEPDVRYYDRDQAVATFLLLQSVVTRCRMELRFQIELSGIISSFIGIWQRSLRNMSTRVTSFL